MKTYTLKNILELLNSSHSNNDLFPSGPNYYQDF